MTIGAVAKSAGVSPSMIRFYETSGIIAKPERKNGIRSYDPGVIEHLRVLRFYRSVGVSIEDLASMFGSGPAGNIRSQHEVVERRIAEIDDVIAQAQVMKRRLRRLLRCRCGGDRNRCVIFRSE